MFLVSSSINVSIFHSTWLETLWIDCIYMSLVCLVHGPLCGFQILLLTNIDAMNILEHVS